MKAITIEHLAPYLPYGLKILREGKIVQLCGLSSPYKTNSNYYINGETKAVNGTHRTLLSFCIDEKHTDSFKPIFRPLSDIVINGLVNITLLGYNSISWIDVANEFKTDDKAYHFLPFYIVNILLEQHFDVFGLIEQGLAIDINTIKPILI